MPLAEEAEIRNRAVRRGNQRAAKLPYAIALHLALFAIGILTPVLLIVTVVLIDAAQLRRDDALRDANTVVRHINATIEVEIQKAIAVAETLATSRALVEGDYAMFDGQARDVANRLGLVIVSRDLSGQQRTSTAAPLSSPLPVSNESILALDRLAAQRRAPVISDLVTGTVMQTWLVIADIPVLKGSEVTSFLDVVLRPQRIGEILSKDLPEGWIAGVIGRDGRLIARSLFQDRYIGTINHPFEPEAAIDRIGGNLDRHVARRHPHRRRLHSLAIVGLAGFRRAAGNNALHAPGQMGDGVAAGGLAAAALCVSLWLGWWLSPPDFVTDPRSCVPCARVGRTARAGRLTFQRQRSQRGDRSTVGRIGRTLRPQVGGGGPGHGRAVFSANE